MTEREERLSTQDIAAGSAPADERSRGAGPAERAEPGGQGEEPLLRGAELEDFRQRWEQVQTRFVDEPRRAVEEADALVAEVMKRLADTFASERSDLETQWDRSGEPDTETLRVTLQRYRSFFDRLLST